MMSASTVARKTWVAFGAAGALGTIQRDENGFAVKLLDDAGVRGVYPSLDVAKSALYALLMPGTDWPEFREH